MPEEVALAALLDRIPVLQGLPRTVVDLHGGLTNRNLRVRTPDRDLVVRLFRGDADLLGIDRDAEAHNTRAAADAGAGPAVVDYLPDLGVLVIEHVDGVTLGNESFAEPGTVERVATACRRLHEGPRFSGDFDMVRRQARYLATVHERGYPLFARYSDFDGHLARLAAALAARPTTTVPCNNDLLAANFIDDGARIWVIDYEYSGNNDACFELGNTATECDLDDDQVEALVLAYFGRLTRHELARVRLQSVVSEYGWALWGAIQAAASPIDHDFLAWGQQRFDKAASTFSSPVFGRLLEDLCRDD
ncbi:phosphotransferase [Nocardioides sp. MAHUQ-72]|uniref:phosphotransferase n=1 Tax=unclassified Nocardioides TaxID=2615069 RepID=UPI00361246D2